MHIQATPPPVNVLLLRRSDLQGGEAKAFDLNPGEISTVLDLPAAFAIMRIESKELIPIQAVRQEVEGALRGGQIQNAVSKLGKKINAQFNLEYLGLSSQPDLFSLTTISPAATRGTIRR